MRPYLLCARLSILVFAVLGLATGAVFASEPELLGHWKLAGNADDASGNGNHGEIHGADMTAPGPDGEPNGAARFNGVNAFIEVPEAIR